MHSMLVAPQGVESFEACCQRALLNVQIITLLLQFTVLHKYIYPPDSKVHAGSFRGSTIDVTHDMLAMMYE